MSKLEEKLAVFERNCDMVTNSQVVSIISALREAVKMHHALTRAVTSTNAQFVLNSKYEEAIMQILEGEE